MSMFKSYSAQNQNPQMPQMPLNPIPAEYVIWKYRLDPDGPMQIETINMPEGAKVLTVGMPDDKLTSWALVDPSAPKVPCNYVVVGTGAPVPTSALNLQDLDYIGTLNNNGLVRHIFFERI